ncbi:MAG: hypothetical protein JWP09_11 [Candidatus Taylorbacteria bacterium]|nr:hypothetical protein [Candidatus Taylorbacteria bacterium]
MFKKRIFTLGMLAVMAVFAVSNVSADTNQGNQGSPNGGQRGGPRMMGQSGKGTMQRPAVMGKIESISGNTLTVAARGFGKDTATTTYSVDATNATVFKSNATSTISSLVVGDNVMVQGTVTGTNVVAKTIRDGMGMMRKEGEGAMPEGFSGNGQPVVAGSVTGVSGSTITISNTSNVTYTIDATNAKVMKGKDAGALSDVALGDHVVVQGTVNGNAITATTVIDQKAPANNGGDSNGQRGQNGGQEHPGFFGAIRGFFGKIFGF